MSVPRQAPEQLAMPVVGELLAVSGPDMQQLHRRYPPRPAEVSWRVTRQDGDLHLTRMLQSPFTDEDQRVRRRRGLVSVIEWLAAHPGDTWQER